MARNIDYFKDLWTEMLRNDKPKVDHLKAIDEAVEFGLELPEELKKLKWMRNIQSTLPAEVMVVGRKTLATIEPQVFIQPLNSNEGTIKDANTREQNILWQFKQADKRARHTMTGDAIESALKYDSIAAMTVPTNWQMKGQQGNLPSRYKAAMNYGGFITMIENPKDIHARFSPLGLDMVLNSKVMRARDAVYYYGEDASLLSEKIEGEDGELYVTVYDYWDYDNRVLWISKPTRHTEISYPNAGGWIMFKEDMDLPFLPWTVVEGGSSLATTEDHKIRPLLGPIVHTKQLELQLILQSMAFSEVTGYAAAPRTKITSHDGETVEINYGDIQANVILKPGEDFEILPPPQIDANLLLVYDRIEAGLNRLAGLKALANLDSPSGTAFATVNAQIKAATTALAPAKLVAERGLSSIAENYLRWTAHTGDDMLGYGTKGDSLGVEYRTKPEHIETKEIYIDVTLSHHIPTDELQQINAVTILMKEVGISFVDAAKRLNVSNPEELLARKRQEDLDNAEYGIAIKKMNADADLEIEAKRMQMQVGMQQALQAQQQPPQQPGANPESQSQARMAQGGFPPTRTGNPRREAQSIAARGQGFNPDRGGLSPNEANPEGFTRESMTGVDREGETI